MAGWLKGKTSIVTGPTSGIGRVIAEKLAAEGSQVVLACRDLKKGEATRAAISKKTGSPSVSVLQVDVANTASIRAFAAAFKRHYQRLHVLVNNAGVNQPRRVVTPENLELTFATNVLGYFRMTRALEEVLLASAPSRIVNVASTYAGDLALDDLQFTRRPYAGMQAYRQSKACDRMLTRAFSRRLAAKGVTVNAMAPGFVLTGLYRHLRLPAALFMRVLNLFIGKSKEAGADTAVWLATSPEVDGKTGLFFEKRLPQPCEFTDPIKEEALYALCDKLSQE
jgi:NAD(P)-dependent dehydrogenase (short-subunit alcohol dehydrogenase family)